MAKRKHTYTFSSNKSSGNNGKTEQENELASAIAQRLQSKFESRISRNAEKTAHESKYQYYWGVLGIGAGAFIAYKSGGGVFKYIGYCLTGYILVNTAAVMIIKTRSN